MTLLRRYTVLSFVLVLLSIFGVCIAQRSITMLVVAGALAAMSWYITEGPRGRTLPTWVSNILVMAVSLSVIPEILQANQADFISVLGRWAVWLTLIKLYEPKSARDQAQLIGLSALLMLVGCLQSTDLLFGLVLILYLGLGLYVLLLYQLFASHERVRAARRAAEPDEAPRRLTPSQRPVAGRSAGLDFRLFTVAVGVFSLIIGMFVFITFPRGYGADSIPQFQSFGRQEQAGFLDRIDLIGGGRISDSRRQALILTIRDEHGRPVESDQPVHLRGAVLERYERGGTWRPLRASAEFITTEADTFTPLGLTPMNNDGTMQTLEVQPLHRSKTVFSIHLPTAASLRGGRVIEYSPSTQMMELGSASRDSYFVQFQPLPTREQLHNVSRRRSGGDTFRHQELDDSRVEQLARSLLRQARLSPEAPQDRRERYAWHRSAARVFEQYLHSSEFQYTLDLSDQVQRMVDGRPVDPILTFLLETKRGHCEYFASAFAALCYNVGVPVRLVTGYLASEFDPVSGRYTVLDANAHAWAEVRTDTYEWSLFDPTPSAVLEQLHAREPTLTDTLRRFYERFDSAWSSAIVEYDAQRQSDIAARVDRTWGDRVNTMVLSVQQFMHDVNDSFRLGPAGYIWMGTVALALVIAVIALVKLMRRSLAMRRLFGLDHLRGREYQRMLRQLGFYLDLLDVLHRGKVGKPVWQPPLLYAESMPAEQAEMRDRVERIAHLFYAARYGQRTLSRSEIRDARQWLAEVAEKLKVRIRF